MWRGISGEVRNIPARGSFYTSRAGVEYAVNLGISPPEEASIQAERAWNMRWTWEYPRQRKLLHGPSGRGKCGELGNIPATRSFYAGQVGGECAVNLGFTPPEQSLLAAWQRKQAILDYRMPGHSRIDIRYLRIINCVCLCMP